MKVCLCPSSTASDWLNKLNSLGKAGEDRWNMQEKWELWKEPEVQGIHQPDMENEQVLGLRERGNWPHGRK